jgi:replicative DNA helicase
MVEEKERKDLTILTLELTDLTEINLLGALLIAGTDGTRYWIEAVSKIVSVSDFMPNSLGGRHRRIFEAMLQSEQTDQITVANTMHRLMTLQEGDIPTMSYMIANAVTSIDCELYAKQVKALAEERRGNKNFKPRIKGGV